MRYRVTCDLLIRAFAKVEVEAESMEEAAEKARQTVNLEDFDEPTLTSLAGVEVDDGDVEEVR